MTMQRLRLFDFRTSRLPEVIGACADDIPRIASAVNTAQRRLLYAKEAGEEGWWGTWAEMAYTVSQSNPYITLPRDVARLETATICEQPIPVRNQFYEYLSFGNGRMPNGYHTCSGLLQSYTRNNVVTSYDLAGPKQFILVYPVTDEDVGKRVLIQGTDEYNNKVYSRDVTNQVEGHFVTIALPFNTTPFSFNSITGIQKDVTAGRIVIAQIDAVTGIQQPLLTMEPGETTASYRRYYFHPLPNECCQGSSTVTVRALVKRELIPVAYDTDYTLLQNMEAIIEEAASARYSVIDTLAAKQMAAERHAQAVALLNGELNHYLGKNSAAIEFAPFGSARLERRRIGALI